MVSAQEWVFGELGGELSFPGPHRAPIPFCHPEVTVATFVFVLLALLEGSPKRGAEQDDGLGYPGSPPGHTQQGVSPALAAVG